MKNTRQLRLPGFFLLTFVLVLETGTWYNDTIYSLWRCFLWNSMSIIRFCLLWQDSWWLWFWDSRFIFW